MIFLKLAAFAVVFCLFLPLTYLLAITISSYFFRKQSSRASAPIKMGVLIPAHNEASGIEKTVSSVLASNYPRSLLEVIIIADNCTDATAENARKAGAVAYEREDPENPGKGQALDWFLSSYRDAYSHLDGITLIDADVEIHPDCLLEIGQSLNRNGVMVVQGFNGVANARAGWRPALLDAAFNVFNHLRLAGLSTLAGTAVLKGLGMGFRTEILARYGWPAHSIVEDHEFTLILLKDGIHVHYNPDAVVRSEMVTRGNQATVQRSRWEGGRFSLAKEMTPVLLRLWLKRHESTYILSLFELLVPPLALMVLWALLSTLATALMLPGLIWLPALQWCILIFYVASGQIQRKAPLATWLYLVTSPLYMAWKIPIYCKMLAGRGTSKWLRTSRENSQDD